MCELYYDYSSALIDKKTACIDMCHVFEQKILHFVVSQNDRTLVSPKHEYVCPRKYKYNMLSVVFEVEIRSSGS